MKGRILIAGSDEVLIATRANILSLSYSVSTCKPEDTIECLQSQQFQLLLVCCSTPFEIASAIILKAHENFAHLCIVRLLSSDHPVLPHPVAHAIVVIDFNPRSWLNEIHALLIPESRAAFA
jgi:hypothetical protein